MKAIIQYSKSLLQKSLNFFFALLLVFGIQNPSWANSPSDKQLISSLAQGNAVTDPKALLRYALPIDNPTIRQIQKDLEDISRHIKGKRWSFISSDVKKSNMSLKLYADKILKSIPPELNTQAQSLLSQLDENINNLNEAVKEKDKDKTIAKQQEALNNITSLEELMVVGFPFEVPDEYKNLPQLKGRAVVALETTQGNLKIVIDGYNAPVNAGNFVDLVKRGFYDGLPFTRAEEFFVVQAGDPVGDKTGFVDGASGQYRTVPLEIFVRGEKTPIYGQTLEEAGYYLPELALPFNAYGAIATARPETQVNGGSSQFFLYRFDTELTPPGFNLMDGRYSVFGYLIEGKDVLDKITTSDKIISAKLISGQDNLVEPQ